MNFPTQIDSIHGAKFTVEIKELKKNVVGVTHASGREIFISDNEKYDKWHTLAHEMTHAGLDMAGVSEFFTQQQEEAIAIAMEATFGPLLEELFNNQKGRKR